MVHDDTRRRFVFPPARVGCGWELFCRFSKECCYIRIDVSFFWGLGLGLGLGCHAMQCNAILYMTDI
jgi:hypothetical protein